TAHPQSGHIFAVCENHKLIAYTTAGTNTGNTLELSAFRESGVLLLHSIWAFFFHSVYEKRNNTLIFS
ncbi:MAG: hypothetical protein MUO88_16745, partial [Desulfobacterales bacterium]|nr:hypothetical protein [Desulfobacterales bacterium]